MSFKLVSFLHLFNRTIISVAPTVILQIGSSR